VGFPQLLSCSSKTIFPYDSLAKPNIFASLLDFRQGTLCDVDTIRSFRGFSSAQTLGSAPVQSDEIGPLPCRKVSEDPILEVGGAK
jgi:hypothetical protein